MNYGIIITGTQGVGKSAFVDNLSRYFNVCSLHYKADVNKYFNYEIILVEALKFKTTIEWKKHSAGSYAAAFNKGWWKNISKQIKEKRNDTL